MMPGLDSNQRPTDSESVVLPAELPGNTLFYGAEYFNCSIYVFFFDTGGIFN